MQAWICREEMYWREMDRNFIGIGKKTSGSSRSYLKKVLKGVECVMYVGINSASKTVIMYEYVGERKGINSLMDLKLSSLFSELKILSSLYSELK